MKETKSEMNWIAKIPGRIQGQQVHGYPFEVLSTHRLAP